MTVPSPADMAARAAAIPNAETDPDEKRVGHWKAVKSKVRMLKARIADIEDHRDALREQRDRALAHADAAWREVAAMRGAALRAVCAVAAERDRARASGVELEQQLDQIRAALVSAAGEVQEFPERHTDEYVRGQYETLLRCLADVLEVTGEHYDGYDPESAAHELACRFHEGRLDSGGKLPQALDLDDEAREAARLDEARNLAGYPDFGCNPLGVSV